MSASAESSMGPELTRRGFLVRSGATAAGAYALMGTVRAQVARAAVDELSTDGATVVVQWSAAALQAIRDTHPGPPMVARALAMTHTAIFDAWAAYDAQAVGTRLGGSLRRPAAERTEANKREAVSYAAHRTLVDLFPAPAQVAQFDALLRSLGYEPPAATDPSAPSAVGTTVAAALVAFRHGDGSNQLAGYADTSGYVPVNDSAHVNDPNAWQPLRPAGAAADQRYIAPHWGLVTPFALTSASQFRPTAGPAQYGEKRYRRQAEDVLELSAKLNDERKSIAEYWADGPSSELPPGHWCLFGHFVSQRDRHDIDADAKMFFALTNAIFDASIAAWDAKRAYNSERPVTAIHALWPDDEVKAWVGPYQGKGKIRGADWRPYQAANVVTPPFPEYLSGHSSFSAAGAEILMRFTGSDAFGASATQLAGTSRVEPGAVPRKDVTLSWRTFSEAADEAGISRRYGGIHFEQGDLDGRVLGRRVGSQAWDKAQAFVRGTAAPAS